MPKRPVVTVGDRVRNARQKKKLSQLELAQQSGVRPEVISRIETGKSPGSLASLFKLAPVLELSLDELINEPRARGKKKGTE